MDLIDRYRKWRVTHSNESDSDSESDSDPQNNRYTCLMDLLSDVTLTQCRKTMILHLTLRNVAKSIQSKEKFISQFTCT